MSKSKSKTVVKKNAWISWWERDRETRHAVVVTVAQAVSSYAADVAEVRKLEAQAARDNAAALLLLVQGRSL
jgi:hypothetical protein